MTGFQRRTDELLQNIPPDEIAERLMTEPSMIADNVGSASVLFADVVDLTPMSAACEPSGPIRVEGKSELETYLLISKRAPGGDATGPGAGA